MFPRLLQAGRRNSFFLFGARGTGKTTYIRDAFDPDASLYLDLHLILDNYGTHKTAKVKRWLLRHPRFHCHFTPTCSSWINLVERFFASLTEHQLRRGSHRSVVALERAIRGYLETHNEQPKPFRWTKSAYFRDRTLGVAKIFAGSGPPSSPPGIQTSPFHRGCRKSGSFPG